MAQEPHNLQHLLDHIEGAARESEHVSLQTVVEAVGTRSFGPLLLVAGVILASPLSGIPGVPTTLGVVVLLIALQLLIGEQEFWLPQWLLRRAVAHRQITRAFNWIRPPARMIDRLLRPRLIALVHSSGTYVIALVCVIIALGMPAMELVPFSATGAGFALTAFGLALVSRDGLLALFAFGFTTLTLGLVLTSVI